MFILDLSLAKTKKYICNMTTKRSVDSYALKKFVDALYMISADNISKCPVDLRQITTCLENKLDFKSYI